MKKVKLALITVAIITSIGGAFASKNRCVLCEYSQQYYRFGTGYLPAGEYGYDYACWQISGSTCTYYKPDPINQPEYYVPCRGGSYFE
jgi:hypothetical protein